MFCHLAKVGIGSRLNGFPALKRNPVLLSVSATEPKGLFQEKEALDDLEETFDEFDVDEVSQQFFFLVFPNLIPFLLIAVIWDRSSRNGSGLGRVEICWD